jgi:kynurenine formamidase
MPHDLSTRWQLQEVSSPNQDTPVPVVVARNIPYRPNSNRLQNLSIYLPATEPNQVLSGTAVTVLPVRKAEVPRFHVHIHGGAWRDPLLGSSSVEAAVAHAFTDGDRQMDAIISINYSLSPFPSHPTNPYDPIRANHSDPAREAVHPMHIQNVLQAFALLKSLGLTVGSYILSGHSAGACLAFQASLFAPQHWKMDDTFTIPRPAALVGMNGLYDLPALVDGLGASHEHLRDVYQDLQGIAFGTDTDIWASASPARVNTEHLAIRLREEKAPKFVLVDQSTEDQLVPMNQMERMKTQLEEVDGLRLVEGRRCVGVHAAPWEQGTIIWDTVKDVLILLELPHT